MIGMVPCAIGRLPYWTMQSANLRTTDLAQVNMGSHHGLWVGVSYIM